MMKFHIWNLRVYIYQPYKCVKIRQLEVSKQLAFLWEYICTFQIVLTV